MTQPRAELYAALLNAHTGEVVRKSFKRWHQSSIKLSDSQITLFWITNNDKPLKEWVRNRANKILRFTEIDQWQYVKSNNMMADLGTRRGVTLPDVDKNSEWFNSQEWMKLNVEDMPIFKVNQLKMSTNEEEKVFQEIHHSSQYPQAQKATGCKQRLDFSNYLIHPGKYRFAKVVRIMALVIKYCKILKQLAKSTSKLKPQPKNSTIILPTDEEINSARNYFFRKCTNEVKHFLPPIKYRNISTLKDGILYYTARMLNTDDITIVGRYNNIMKDLSASTFCVPLIDKSSPVAISIVNDVHWHHKTAKHSGVETTQRFVRKEAFIIEGRGLIKMVRKKCRRCRYLMKKTVDVAMGPVSKLNLTIAPAFYASQVDLCGPFSAYSPHHKRTTIKIWLLVFCCATTSTTSIKVMDDYSTQSFIMGFTRFSCEVGYPKILLCDGGSQLIRGCQDMRLSYTDIRHQLHKQHQINFEVCPVGGHNEHGKVERKIREITTSVDLLYKERFSILQWETLATSIANSINNMPLAINGIVSDLENLDILTPNRLKLGRNNERSPTEPVELLGNQNQIVETNRKIFQAWFENWLLSHVPKLLQQSKWYDNDDEQIKVGNVVLFFKNESKLSSDYQYGIVVAVDVGNDGLVRRASVRYKNAGEQVFRETRRSTRTLVIIQHVDAMEL